MKSGLVLKISLALFLVLLLGGIFLIYEASLKKIPLETLKEVDGYVKNQDTYLNNNGQNIEIVESIKTNKNSWDILVNFEVDSRVFDDEKNNVETKIKIRDLKLVGSEDIVKEGLVISASECEKIGRVFNAVLNKKCNENEINYGEIYEMISPAICCVSK